MLMLAAPCLLLLLPRRGLANAAIERQGEQPGVLRSDFRLVGGAGVKDARLILPVREALAFLNSLCPDHWIAVLQGGPVDLRHDPLGGRAAVLEEALGGRHGLSHATRLELLQAVVLLLAVEVPAVSILGTSHLPGLDHSVAVVRTDQDVDIKILPEVEEVRREKATCASNGVPSFPVEVRGVHSIVCSVEHPVRRQIGRRVAAQDLLAVPEDLEPLVAALRTHVLNDKGVVLDHWASQSDAHRRAGSGEAVGVAKATVDVELFGLDQIELARIGVGHWWPIDAVKADNVRIPEDRALAPRPRTDNFRDIAVPAARLALAGVDVPLAIAHGLEGNALGPVGEHDGLAARRSNARPPALILGHVVQRGAGPGTRGAGEPDRPRASPEARQAAGQHVLGECHGRCGGHRCWASESLLLAAPRRFVHRPLWLLLRLNANGAIVGGCECRSLRASESLLLAAPRRFVRRPLWLLLRLNANGAIVGGCECRSHRAPQVLMLATPLLLVVRPASHKIREANLTVIVARSCGRRATAASVAAAPCLLWNGPCIHPIAETGSAIKWQGGCAGRRKACNALLRATPLLLGDRPSGLVVVESRLAVVVEGGGGHRATASRIAAAPRLLRCGPSRQPVVVASVAVKWQGGRGGWGRGGWRAAEVLVLATPLLLEV
mmetsp:Transcript_71856/g.222846  ORF Transcript_71856/g.222846 Transcript_71856/m.222846 type:complete len:664 (-) Transcript_71856:427-2418(-)